MRITDKLKYDTFKRNIADIQERMNKTTEMIAAQKRILKPSDDPVSATRVVQLQAQKNTDAQYARNLNRLKAMGSMYETSINTVSSVLTSAKQLAVTMSSDNMNASVRKAAAEDVKGMIEQLITVGNTKVGSAYIFGGNKSDAAPYTLNEADYSVTFQGTADVPQMIVSSGQKMNSSISGQKIFDTGGNADIFAALKDLKEALENNDTSGIRESIDAIGGGVDLTANNLTYLGTYTARLDTLSATLESKTSDLDSAISELLDADTVSLYSEYTSLSTAYEAALAAMAKMQQLSVLNYLS